jgi:chaperone required for assembly of F1-ATPase
MKRFYTDVAVTDARGIALDGRPVKTPAKAPLILPNPALAHAVAEEWRAQGDAIVPQSMPLTGLANAAIDRVADAPEAFAAGLAAYAETELLCYRAADPPPLVTRQNTVWDPILDWARARYDVGFTLVAGIMHQSQPVETLKRLGSAVSARGMFELAALSPIVTISGSLVLTLAVLEQEILPDAAFDTAHLDELWQEEQWGADDFALEARAAHRRDFLGACRFLEFVRNGAGD